LGAPTTLLAGEVLAGFEEPLGSRPVPIQEQFSLGGRRALRGVSVHDRLARNIGVARLELRQDVYPQFDWNLFDVLTYRRPQLQLFCDRGRVDDPAGRALTPDLSAPPGGIGFNALSASLGFSPARAYIEIAPRLDRDQQDFQFLLGTRQAF